MPSIHNDRFGLINPKRSFWIELRNAKCAMIWQKKNWQNLNARAIYLLLNTSAQFFGPIVLSFHNLFCARTLNLNGPSKCTLKKNSWNHQMFAIVSVNENVVFRSFGPLKGNCACQIVTYKATSFNHHVRGLSTNFEISTAQWTKFVKKCPIVYNNKDAFISQFFLFAWWFFIFDKIELPVLTN